MDSDIEVLDLIPDGVAFESIDYVDHLIPPKDIYQIEVPFDRSKFGGDVSFRFEYHSKLDQCPTFGLHFIADNEENHKNLTLGVTSKVILIPTNAYQCFQRPLSFCMPVTQFSSGKFLLTWDNSLQFNSRAAKSISYKIQLENTESHFHLHTQVDVPRKQSITIPVLYNAGKDLLLNIDYSTASNGIPFVMYFEPFPQESNDSASIATNKSDTMLPAKRTIIPYSKPIGKSITTTNHSVVLRHGFGVYSLTWDNSQSLVSTKRIHMQIDIRKETS
jgi:hypothetical protein